MRTMGAGEFKAKCLAVMDMVATTGEPVLVTKRGKPVARIVAAADGEERLRNTDSIFGFMRGLGTVPADEENGPGPFAGEEWGRMAVQRWRRAEPKEQP